MSDQKSHWNNLHNQRTLGGYSTDPTEFAKQVINHLPKNSQILELGCGLGNDSVYFAKSGMNVIATDFSEVVIEKNRKQYQLENLEFSVVDTSKPLPFKDKQFDLVYARLSLHYFDDKTTKKVFEEIHRVLNTGGTIAFICKSTLDPLYGQGDEIEKDVFVNEGHIRHFFSPQYIHDLLNRDYYVKSVQGSGEDFYGHQSAFIEVVAKKI